MRLHNRMDTDAAVECAFDGRKSAAQLYNLSCGGCMIETSDKEATVGAPVVIDFDETTKVPGRVAWHVGKNIGIKFDVPLHTAVINRFGFGASDEKFDEHDLRDRFGLPLDASRRSAAGHLELIAE